MHNVCLASISARIIEYDRYKSIKLDILAGERASDADKNAFTRYVVRLIMIDTSNIPL